jgi:hypothetical protein
MGKASLVTTALNCSAALIGRSAALRIAVLSTLALSVRVEEREGGRRFGRYLQGERPVLLSSTCFEVVGRVLFGLDPGSPVI